MRRMELRKRRKRVLRMLMMKKEEKRTKMEMRMGKSRIDTQRSDLQRRKRRMKWIQRDRRQKTGLQLESSLRIHAPSISLPSSPCLYCPFSLWLHTVSDEGGLKNGVRQGKGQFPFYPKVQYAYSAPKPEAVLLPTPSLLLMLPVLCSPRPSKEPEQSQLPDPSHDKDI